MMKKDIREDIQIWANAHMIRTSELEALYPTWEATWLCEDQAITLRLRLVGTNHSADIVVGSCPQGYAGNDANWQMVNLGIAISLSQIQTLYRWLETKANHKGPL